MARVEILDVGSNKGKALKANAEEALHELGLSIEIEEVREISQLLEYGISGIPALVIDGRVVLQKLVPSPKELRVVLSILLSAPAGAPAPLRTIVAPTDFSDVALNALAYAKSIAAVQGAGLNVVHVHQAQPLAGNPYLTQPAENELEWKESQLDSFLVRPVSTNGYESSEVVIRKEMIMGPVVEEIKRISRLPETDMIVMGTTGKNHLLNRIFGSVSSEIARRAFCPVLLVPGEARFRGFRHIIFAGNYEPHEDIVLPHLLEFARLFGSKVQYVHVNANAEEAYAVDAMPLEHTLKDDGEITEIITIESHDVLDGLTRYAVEQEADLIAMSTTQRPFLEAIFHHSITREAALNISIPLLILHPEDQQ